MITTYFSDSSCSPASITGLDSLYNPGYACTPQACSPNTFPPTPSPNGDHVFGYQTVSCSDSSSAPVAAASFPAGSSYLGIVEYTNSTCSQEYLSSYIKADGSCYYTGANPAIATVSPTAGGVWTNWVMGGFDCSGSAVSTKTVPILGGCQPGGRRYVVVLNGSDLAKAAPNQTTTASSIQGGTSTTSAATARTTSGSIRSFPTMLVVVICLFAALTSLS